MGEKVKHTGTVERKYRVQLDFSDEAFRELNALQQRLGGPSRAEVVRNALTLLRWVCEKVGDEGYQIVARKEAVEGSRTVEHIVEPIFPFSVVKK